MDGILVVDKPRGITSRQVVNKVGRRIAAEKVGHAGTLDPLATGVLVLCIGRGTLITQYLSAQGKTYEVDALLGVETDTYDIEGKVLRKQTTDRLELNEVERALDDFRGSLNQKPPPYSAVKHNGKPLYYYARKGLKVETRPRKVNVDDIRVISFDKVSDGVHLDLLISCGSGTYIRSIINDLGRGLGCGACVFSLRRRSSGDISEDSAVPLEKLLSLENRALMEHMLSLEYATRSMPGVSVSPDGERRTALGEPLLLECVCERSLNPDGESIFRILDGEGGLIALYGPPKPEDGPEICGRAVRVLRPLSFSAEKDEPA